MRGRARRDGAEYSMRAANICCSAMTIRFPRPICSPTIGKCSKLRSNLRQCVLGDFRLPPAAQQRALTRFLAQSSFFFPQATLRAGEYWEYTYVVTCNLSVKRDAVLAAGSFDARCRVAEDSDLGVRLSRKGFSVLYVPEEQAIHQHLPFTIPDLMRRAAAYGANQLRFCANIPRCWGTEKLFLECWMRRPRTSGVRW